MILWFASRYIFWKEIVVLNAGGRQIVTPFLLSLINIPADIFSLANTL